MEQATTEKTVKSKGKKELSERRKLAADYDSGQWKWESNKIKIAALEKANLALEKKNAAIATQLAQLAQLANKQVVQASSKA